MKFPLVATLADETQQFEFELPLESCCAENKAHIDRLLAKLTDLFPASVNSNHELFIVSNSEDEIEATSDVLLRTALTTGKNLCLYLLQKKCGKMTMQKLVIDFDDDLSDWSVESSEIPSTDGEGSQVAKSVESSMPVSVSEDKSNASSTKISQIPPSVGSARAKSEVVNMKKESKDESQKRYKSQANDKKLDKKAVENSEVRSEGPDSSDTSEARTAMDSENPEARFQFDNEEQTQKDKGSIASGNGKKSNDNGEKNGGLLEAKVGTKLWNKRNTGKSKTVVRSEEPKVQQTKGKDSLNDSESRSESWSAIMHNETSASEVWFDISSSSENDSECEDSASSVSDEESESSRISTDIMCSSVGERDGSEAASDGGSITATFGSESEISSFCGSTLLASNCSSPISSKPQESIESELPDRKQENQNKKNSTDRAASTVEKKVNEKKIVKKGSECVPKQRRTVIDDADVSEHDSASDRGDNFETVKERLLQYGLPHGDSSSGEEKPNVNQKLLIVGDIPFISNATNSGADREEANKPTKNVPEAVLQRGDTGESVETLQKLLIDFKLLKVCRIGLSGVFCHDTAAAVQEFRRANDVKSCAEEGVYCAKTATALKNIVTNRSDNL